MKPILEDISLSKYSSFSLKRDILPHIDVPLHFHAEYEWVLNVKGRGKRFVGDSIMDFDAGDLVFMGGHLPHFWKNNSEHYQGNKNVFADVVVIHFKKDAFGDTFFSLPEMNKINQLLEKSSKGIAFSGKTKMIIADKMIQMLELEGVHRFIGLIEILKIASEYEEDWELLSTNDYGSMLSFKDSMRLQGVFQFVSDNYDKHITLTKIATIANMNKTAFSRYFKQITGKGFIEYLNEVRINYAKKLLAAQSNPIKEIGYSCGFSSPSYFNKTFKDFVGMTPVEFRRHQP